MNQRMYELGSKRSVIRELFEFGKARAAEIGAENVFDFSLGNPSVEPPACVQRALAELLREENQTALHGYTSAQGDVSVRRAMAEHIRKNYDSNADENYIYMTVGAAASLTITLSALCVAGDEVITFAPYFTEYKVFVETAGAKLIAVESEPTTFQIDFEKLEGAIGERTRAVLINSPNNPSGVVYNRRTVEKLCDILRRASVRLGRTVYLISDEPYRELVYNGVEVPYVTRYYENSFVCYSFSKSLSLPGERIGYIYVNPKMPNAQNLYLAVFGAGRALGYVCAPSLFQKVAARCVGQTADVSIYQRNRDALVGGLRACGFTCVKPDGAFYLFVRSPEEDAQKFCERARKYNLLIVPCADFGCKNYARIAYCVAPQVIERAMPAFRKLAAEYGLQGEV